MRLTPILLAASGLSLLPMSALTQEQEKETGGLRYTLDVDQRFGAGDNPGLEVPSQGSFALSNTQLIFGVSSETDIQKIALNFGGSLLLGQAPEGVDTGFTNPLINFEYDREGADSALSFGAGYEESDISFLRVSDFIDENGTLDIPEDSDDLTGSGTRNQSYLNARLETGIDDPIGFLLTADTQSITYDNATSTELEDYRRSLFGATTRLRFSEATTAEVELSYNTYDNTTTDRDNASIRFGLSHALSASTQIEGSLGYEKTNSDVSGVTSIEDGLVYSLALIRDMPNGTATASLDSNRDYLGERLRARLSRSMELPDGALSYSVGGTNLNGGNVNFIGYLNWEKELPQGDINLSLNQDVGFNSDDDERLYTTGYIEYIHTLTERSDWGVGALYSKSDYGDSGQTVKRANITTAYKYELTSEWNLIVGASYRLRDEENVGQAESGAVFVNVAKSFEFLQ